MKKTISAFFFTSLLLLSACSGSNKNSNPKKYYYNAITSTSGGIYGLGNDSSSADPLKDDNGQDYAVNIYFINDENSIPYADVSEMFPFFNSLDGSSFYDDSQIADGVLTFNGTRGDTVTFSAKDNKIYFSDFHYLESSNENPLNIASFSGNTDTFQCMRLTDSYYYGGVSETINLDDYHIQMYTNKDGEDHVLLPYAVLSCISMKNICIDCYTDERGVFFNTVASYKDTDGNPSPFAELFNAKAGPYTDSFAEFQYNALCLNMDYNYGLRDTHGMENGFDDFCIRGGYKEGLTSTNPETFEDTLARVIYTGIDDCHTSYGQSGAYAGTYRPTVQLGKMYTKVGGAISSFGKLRSETLPGLQAYSEYNDTAYITFDSFVYTRDFYNDGYVAKNDASSTSGLLYYANQQIRREDSPIKNVVLDLSANGGGMLNAAIEVLSWCMNGVTLYLDDPINGARGYTTFQADVNGDMIFDANDTISDLNIYCLTSVGSFSCGNLVPCMLKSWNKAVILGQTSGGGSDSVLMRSTAGGSFFRCSSRNRLCTYKNGTYYSVDQGAEPDIHLADSQYYDRAYLDQIIHS